MCVVYEPNHCQQCNHNSAKFDYDSRSGGYETSCGRCGRRERHESMLDDEGFYCGFRHEAFQGFGVLFFRYTSGHEFYSYCLNTPRETIDAEVWLREGLDTGTVDADTASLTRWNDEDQRIEVVRGERVDLLAGKVVRKSGVPDDRVPADRDTVSFCGNANDIRCL